MAVEVKREQAARRAQAYRQRKASYGGGCDGHMM